MICQRPCLSTLLLDRRGVTAIAFAISLLPFLGLVALATEVGSWYVGWIQAQNAADAAALAGARAAADANALSAATNGPCLSAACGAPMQAAATDAALDTAHRNGYSAQGSSGGFSYSVATPAVSSTFVDTLGANSWLVNEVQITVNVAATYIVSLFNDMLPTLGTRAVAYVNTTALACVLSTAGDLTISNNVTNAGPPCMLASNATDETAITISGSPTIAMTGGLTTSGDCSPLAICTNLPVTLHVGDVGVGQAFKAYQPATINPFTAINSLVPTSSNAYTVLPPTACPSGTGGGYLVPAAGIPGNASYPPAAKPYAYSCPSIDLSSGTWLLMPGTYYFLNTPLTFSGGTVQCTDLADGNGVPSSTGSCVNAPGHRFGVSFLLLGDPPASAGTLTIDSSVTFESASDGSINFGAPDATNSTANNPSALAGALTGVLFYGIGGGLVNITGGGGAYLNGAIYFPNATINYTNQVTPSCTVLIANTVNLNASSFARGCGSYGNTMPQTQTVLLGG